MQFLINPDFPNKLKLGDVTSMSEEKNRCWAKN